MQVLEERRATGDSPVARAEALIEEARQRTRRRRLYTAFAFVVIVLGALIGSIATRGNGHAPRIPRPYPQVQTTGVAQILNLSAGDRYESLTAVSGRLVLSGGPGGSLLPSASDADQTAAQLSACHSAVVNPVTLKLSNVQSGACENPALYGEKVLPVNDAALGKANASTIRLAVAEAGGKSYRVGPVVMRYSDFGTTDAEWVYGDGSLWIYDPLVTATSAELLRVSEQTGAVVQRIAMPQLPEPLLATNADGLWLANGLAPLGSSTPGLYHVPPGSNAPTLVSRQGLQWLVASGHSVWFMSNNFTSNNDGKIWHLQGSGVASSMTFPSATASAFISGGPGGGSGYGAPGYVLDSSGDLWLVSFPDDSPATGKLQGSESQQVNRISLKNGSWSRVANLQPKLGYGNDIHFGSDGSSYDTPTIGIPNSGVALDSPEWANHPLTTDLPMVTVGGSAFVLDPPAHSLSSSGNFSGFSALYRITHKHS
jgi:hypothetical protein